MSRHYVTRCDRCRVAQASGDTEQASWDAATAAGWATAIDGIAEDVCDLCPECKAACVEWVKAGAPASPCPVPRKARR